jgi:hypothetical protein
MTDLIRAEQLLPSGEIDRIIARTPQDLTAFQKTAAELPLGTRPRMANWIGRFMHGPAERLAAGSSNAANA